MMKNRDKKVFFKSYSMNGLKTKDMLNIQEAIILMGFRNDDYKIVHFGSHGVELKVTNRELHCIVKSILKLVRQK